MKYLILLLSIGLLVFSAYAEEFTFTPPTQRADDSPLPASEIAMNNPTNLSWTGSNEREYGTPYG